MLSDARAETGAISGLAERLRWNGETEIRHLAAPLGVVRIDLSTCTGCLACADVCSSGTLQSEHGPDALEISFDRELCDAC